MDYAWKEHSPQSFLTETLQKTKLESKPTSAELHWKYIYTSHVVDVLSLKIVITRFVAGVKLLCSLSEI